MNEHEYQAALRAVLFQVERLSEMAQAQAAFMRRQNEQLEALRRAQAESLAVARAALRGETSDGA